MAKKQATTTNTMIRSALRRLFLHSPERSKALKDANYTCQECGRKQSRAKGKEVYVQVHHLTPVNWLGLFDEIRARLLHSADRYRVLCKECHKEIPEKPKGRENEKK